MHTYHKSIYDASSLNDMKLPTHVFFKQLAEEIFPNDNDIVSAYSP
jgi:hypothetical protein